eukprot:1194241-Prorocentrum_minimum.AAC.2
MQISKPCAVTDSSDDHRSWAPTAIHSPSGPTVPEYSTSLTNNLSKPASVWNVTTRRPNVRVALKTQSWLLL